jgi:hypothetical protein
MRSDEQVEHGTQMWLLKLRLRKLIESDEVVLSPARRMIGIAPIEIVQQQPPTRPQQSLDQQYGETVDRPILGAVEEAEVICRQAVAVSV